MLTGVLLPCCGSLELDEVTVEHEMVTLAIHCPHPVAACPDCHQWSERVHSHYWRTVADLPWAERRVQWHLRVRRFFCDNAHCARRTFTERFPGLVAPHARRTGRLAARQHRLGLALGGEGGAQALTDLAMPVSGDTVLRLIHCLCPQGVRTPRVLGIDDWAWCRGQRYGTILVDLERHRVVDLLPDRSADSLAAWLQTHPGVEIVSRDRAPEYIKGIGRGAPNAIQVADRWHLLRNLRDILVRLLERNQVCLYAVAQGPEGDPVPGPTSEINTESTDPPALTKAEQERQATRERRLTRYRTVIDLHQEGVKMRSIARQMGLSRRTVRHYIQAGGFPEMSQGKPHRSILDPYLPYLVERWAGGGHNGVQLYREIRERGYTGSRPLVSRWAAMMRRQDSPSQSCGGGPMKPKRPVKTAWSPRRAVGLLLKSPEKLSGEDKAALDRMLNASSVLRRAYSFAQAFIRIVRHRLSKAFAPWLTAVAGNRPPELSSFARSLEQDRKAVVAALSLPWSNGQVEGQVNRLKLVKRQMYGRAGFDLLRSRVLARSGP